MPQRWCTVVTKRWPTVVMKHSGTLSHRHTVTLVLWCTIVMKQLWSGALSRWHIAGVSPATEGLQHTVTPSHCHTVTPSHCRAGAQS
eukprot:335867-Chlamydomonas_euryale.AAC.8